MISSHIEFLIWFCCIVEVRLFSPVSQSFVSAGTHGYLFYTLDYNPIYLVQIVTALAIGSSFN